MMLQRTVLVALGILGVVSQLTRQEASAQEIQVFSGASERQSTRLGYWDPKSGMVGMLSLHYGNPVWKAEYDSMLAASKYAEKSLRLRLGSGVWTTLNTDLPLRIGTLAVDPGQYYLGLQVSDKGDFGLLIAKASDVRKRRLSAASTDRLKKVLVAPLKHRLAKEPVAKLEIKLAKAVQMGRSTLQITWGGHVLSVPVLASVHRVSKKVSQKDVSTAMTDLASLQMAVELFAIRKGSIPSLADLIKPNANGQAFLKGYSEAPEDPWGAPYQVVELKGRMNFEVISLGPDGAKGTADDLSSKKRKR